MDYPDSELSYYLHDNNEVASDIIYNKYKFIIDVLLNKYRRVFYALNIDIEEVRQEANLAFSYAIYNYDSNRDASMNTFITICVERRIRKVIKSYETLKNKVNSEAVSLDKMLNDGDVSLNNFIGDNTYEPSKNVENKDTLEYINTTIHDNLSKLECEVYNLMVKGLDYIEISKILDKTPKQIDNTIQRIRLKLKKIKENS